MHGCGQSNEGAAWSCLISWEKAKRIVTQLRNSRLSVCFRKDSVMSRQCNYETYKERSGKASGFNPLAVTCFCLSTQTHPVGKPGFDPYLLLSILAWVPHRKT